MFLNSWNTVSFSRRIRKKKRVYEENCEEGVDKGAGFDCFLGFLSDTTYLKDA
jgi:hypothetical protein